MEVVGYATRQALYPRKKYALRMEEEAEWLSEVVWTGVENLAPTEIRSPELPVRSESLYSLHYSGPYCHKGGCC
jgi:hypothetical protein